MFSLLFREITCYLDVYDNCGTEIFGKMPFPVKGYTKFIAGLCDKSSPQRQSKYPNSYAILKITIYNKVFETQQEYIF